MHRNGVHVDVGVSQMYTCMVVSVGVRVQVGLRRLLAVALQLAFAFAWLE